MDIIWAVFDLDFEYVEQSKGDHADHHRAIEHYLQAHSIAAAKLVIIYHYDCVNISIPLYT